VFDGGGQDGMGGRVPGPVTNEPPQVGIHQGQACPDQPGKASGGFTAASLEDILAQDGSLPVVPIQTTEQQISYNSALGHLERPSGDVGPISHGRRAPLK
jgi:hypothetical protein